MTKSTSKKHAILIVEDETSLSSALKLKFEHENIMVLLAKNGEEGLAVSLKEHPEVILLDIVMPKMDGLAMLKKLREDVWGKTAKVIILTNLSDKESVIDEIEGHPYEYLVKSDWKIEAIVTKVKEKIGILP